MARGYAADTVEGYLAAVPDAQRAALTAVRAALLAAIPDATEGISYQIPIFTYRGKGLLGLSAAQKHCSLHLMSPPLAAALKAEHVLTEGTLSGATLQFPNDSPLSDATVRLIVERRIAEVDARG
ncbi:iron chaperone [Herbiconiux sp. UC225_62]|uniref:iron chaperone n=1 Tax=Herbiconiux sp. UC225_62 TaxID=3350168 RepID=UPI0036D408E0